MSAMMDAIKKAQQQPVQAAKPAAEAAQTVTKPELQTGAAKPAQDETLVAVLTKALEMAKAPAANDSAELKVRIEDLKKQNASLAESVKQTAERNKELVESNNELEKALDNLPALTMDLTVDPKSIPAGIVQDHYDGVQNKAAALFGVIKDFNELAKANPALTNPQTFIDVIKAIAVAPC